MWSKLLAKLVTSIVFFGMPVVQCYHLCINNVFLNTRASDASGLEKLGNDLLTPVQYLMAGKTLVRVDHESLTYDFRQTFDYSTHLNTKTVAATILAVPSLIAGSLVKGVAYLSSDVRDRHHKIKQAFSSFYAQSNRSYYESIGLEVNDYTTAEKISPLGSPRRPGDEKMLEKEKAAMMEIIQLFQKAEIPCWVDCGTLLGAYRYGGAIPWDNDVDLAVLEPDFRNVVRVLSQLDPKKYHVQDWSNRCLENTYIRVYIKETREHIDIYHFRIDPEKKVLSYILSNGESRFMLNSWKQREIKYTRPLKFDDIFPLKKADFDGVEVPVPNRTVPYLQSVYGEDLSPICVYSELTGEYERDLNHPYWKNNYR